MATQCHLPPRQPHRPLLIWSQPLCTLLLALLISSALLIAQADQQSTVHLPTIDGQLASISASAPLAPPSTSCAAPEVLVNGAPSASVAGTVNGNQQFGSISEIQFVGVVQAEAGGAGEGALGQKRICKIKCLNGVWIGPLCAMENAELFEPILRPCNRPAIGNGTVSPLSPSLESSSSPFEPPDEPLRQLAHGSLVAVRCLQPGLYRLQGPRELTCVDGLWSGQLPTCAATSLHSSSPTAPPTILYTLIEGSSALGLDARGRILVPPGAMLHLDCLFHKSKGEPSWTVTPTEENAEPEGRQHRQRGRDKSSTRRVKPGTRSHTTGWSIASSSVLSSYRLAIYSATEADSARYRCQTPHGTENEVEIVVKEVECPPMEPLIAAVPDRHRVHSISGRRLNDRARFGCLAGYRLEGAEESRCTASGRWHRPVPSCKESRCPSLEQMALDPHLFLLWNASSPESTSELSAHDALSALADPSVLRLGTRLSFRCALGYRMRGSEEVTCTESGHWSQPFPSCHLITCPAPSLPAHGHLVEGSGRYLLGDYIQFGCAPGHVLRGQAVATCRAEGTWDIDPPSCQPVCSPPSLGHGHLFPSRLQYEPQSSVEVTCQRGYRIRLGSGTEENDRPIIRCTEEGTWSDTVTCEIA